MPNYIVCHLDLVKYLVVPFYRISILLQDDKIVQEIREHDNSNIDYVTNLFRAKASATYGKNLMDIEAAMLSKNSSAVKNYLEDKLRQMRNKNEWHKFFYYYQYN